MRLFFLVTYFLFPSILVVNGQINFQNYFGNLIYDSDVGTDVIITSDSCYLFTGTVFVSSNIGNELLLMKTTSTGTILWKKLYGCGLNERGEIVRKTYDNGFIVAGNSGVSAGLWHSYLIKTDANGDTLWTRAYWENNDDERIEGVCQTPDSGYLFSGSISSLLGYTGLYIFKVDSSGNLLWSKSYEGAGYGTSIVPVNGGYMVLGSSNNNNNLDILLMKLDFNGDTLWYKSYGGLGEEYPSHLSLTSDNGYILTGRTTSFGFGSGDILVLKTDSNGTLLWAKTYGTSNNDQGTSVCQTNDGGYIIAGSRKNTLDKGFLMKTDSAGNRIWSCIYTNGLSYTSANSVLQTYDDGYIMTGQNDDGLVSMVKVDPSGNSGCNQQFVTIASQNATLVQSFPVLIMHIVNTIDYGSVTVSSPGGTFHSGCLSLSADLETKIQDNFEVFPNPATSSFIVNNSDALILELVVYDSIGKLVYSVLMERVSGRIECINYSPGIYLVKIRTENGYSVKKLVVE